MCGCGCRHLFDQEIGVRLSISTATVKTHISNLCAKAGVCQRAQGVRYAYQHGLVAPPGRTIT
ncbi:LuxR C-terminal-related transcriptional regulator [Streptomyces sp. NPDC012508]|uniref:LuxR C-terminal-related transcriptional regulator n=1 Tax=Streptomyces sp. NPDC012508 TaxID=3364837 RepID=UPI0036AB7B35